MALTFREEIFLMNLKKVYDKYGIKDAIVYLFNSDIVSNFNIAWETLEYLSKFSNINIYNDEIKVCILNIIGKKNNIDDLSKYDYLQGITLKVLETWKKEKDLFVQKLILKLSEFKELEVNERNK